ncbi:MAG: tryptophan synthase subunit alpha [Porticoccaceae bacterium]|nr:tryptophan synthase subunit alpha [Porticoccaceae bacterium]MEA3298695.1 tryptophan synthase subunit alpha [Pseudomonadota bacterium]HLS99322.1 tryptophan synthase subunit alpha [Porticoccaceae bacterium]
MGLEQYLRERKAHKDLLIMTHVVCGYPSFEDNWAELEIMAEFGVDIVELQFPFSEPSADGPLFVRANELALKRGVTPADCFAFMKKVSDHFPFKVLMMGYYNTAFKMGAETFLERLKDAGGCGYILPDLPVDEARQLHGLSEKYDLAPVVLMTPTSTDRNLAKLGAAARGMVYAVARKGVTGSKTDMGEELDRFLARCRQYTDLPIGVGFGVSGKEDIDFLRGRADMAIIGTAALRAWEEGGAEQLRGFFARLGI